MVNITEKIIEISKKSLLNKEVDAILGWKKGDLWWDSYPVEVSELEEVDSLIWDMFCVNNLSKFLMKERTTNRKIGVFLKGCDAMAFNQLLKDNRVKRSNITIYGIPCDGMIDSEKVKKAVKNKRVLSVSEKDGECLIKTKDSEVSIEKNEIKFDKCLTCVFPNPVVYDELLCEKIEITNKKEDRFVGVKELEAMTPNQRYEFWKSEFSRCIRCNACRDICPACNCVKCIFDNENSDILGKAKNESEDSFFHLVRAYHVAGRCVDCGECGRVCPEGIPLELLNRKIINDLNGLYGEFDAGSDSTTDAPLVSFNLEDKDSFTEKGGR
ncbi:MAG: 4Fe-4S dicluster domain-containing protein [Psychrilyobacter sp.]|nr:4Fe-4S dicluster domain-containing protein [Psychrilyobacter sp.]